jgi:hypothetical protein
MIPILPDPVFPAQNHHHERHAVIRTAQTRVVEGGMGSCKARPTSAASDLGDTYL